MKFDSIESRVVAMAFFCRFSPGRDDFNTAYIGIDLPSADMQLKRNSETIHEKVIVLLYDQFVWVLWAIKKI